MKISDKKPAAKEESDDEDIPDIEDADLDDNVVEEEDPVCPLTPSHLGHCVLSGTAKD